jgi:hypothetical protein
MRHFFPFFLSISFFLNLAYSNEKKTLFEGFGARIVSIVDDMTDKKSGVIFLDFGPIYMAIYGHNDFIIWANKENLNFAFDVTHLIRIGKNNPLSLSALTKRNCLKPANSIEANSIIKALAKGDEIKLRYYNWPQNNQIDIKLQNLNLGFIYYKAEKYFGWKDLGVSKKLSAPKLHIYTSPDPDDEGYAVVKVVGNSELSLKKNFDKFGGGATIDVGILSGFGLHEGEWICNNVELSGDKYLTICDSTGDIIFKELLPSAYSDVNTGEPWPEGETAAKMAWEAAPLGSIEIEGSYGKKVLLYGFRELWKWGIENADFPSLE